MDKRKLLNFNYEIFSIHEYKEYYNKNRLNFTSLGEKFFLKSVGIPPTYYLNQPEETKTELIDNQADIIEATSSLRGKFIVVLRDESDKIVNSCRNILDNIQLFFDKVSIKEDSLKGFIPLRLYLSEGYSTFFKPSKNLRGDFVEGDFLDFPLLPTKKLYLHKGSCKLPEHEGEPFKSVYKTSILMDLNDTWDLELFLQENCDTVKVDFVKLKDTYINKELELLLLELQEVKVLTGGLVKNISKKIDKEELIITNYYELLDLITDYDYTVKKYNQVTCLRNCYTQILKIIKDTENDLT